MKKIYAVLLATSCVGISHAELFRYTDPVLGLEYELDTATHTALVAEGSKATGTLIIPSQVNYESTNSKNGIYDVTSIGRSAFTNAGVTSVTFPDGLLSIDSGAFSDCQNLTEVNFPESLKTISDLAFKGTGVTDFRFPQNIEEISGTFADNSSLSITFEIKDIEKWLTSAPLNRDFYIESNNPAFLDAANGAHWTYAYELNGREIKNLLIPMGVEKVKGFAFFGAENLASISFPDGMTEIGEYAFAWLPSLEEVKLNDGMRRLGDYVFSNNTNVASVTLPEGIEFIGESAFQNNTAISKIEIPSTVKTLGANVFMGCLDLETVILPSQLEQIEPNSFMGCLRLKNLTLPENLKTIGAKAFYGTTSLLEVKLPESIKEIGEQAFMIDFDDNYAKFEMNFPDGLEVIGDKAIGCRGIRYITLPSTLKTIGNCAFGMTRVMELVIPASVTQLGEKALAACPFLTKVTLPSTLTFIGKEAFASSPITSIEIPASVTTISNGAFSGMKLSTITIPDGVTELGADIVKGNADLAYVEIGKGVTSLQNLIGAPDNCVLKLTSATPPTLSTSRLGFEPSLILVPNGSEQAYKSNNRWKDYRIAGENSARVDVYVNEPGTLATEIRIQTGKMPAEVTNLNVEGTLNDSDFATIRSNMTSCYDINLSKISNTTIPEKAFINKSNLINVILPSKLKTINDDAFSGCAVMHLSGLPETLTAIGERAFQGCLSMDNDFVAPASLTTIGVNAFDGCRNIKSFDLSSSKLTALPESVFAYCENLAKVVLPEGITTIPAYAMRNSGISEITIPESVESIGEMAFTQCPHLSNIVIPEGTRSIGVGAFLATAIRSIELPSTLTELGTGAFRQSLLAYVTLPDGLKKLHPDMFADCSELLVVNLPSKLEEIYEAALSTPSLTAINSPALQPAECFMGNPFKNVDNYSCALSIPKQSYTPYLLAEYWGSFIGIRNSIDVVIDEGVDVSYMQESDYQDMLESIFNGKTVSARQRSMKVMRDNDVININKGYGKLFNGASLYRQDNSEIRVFLDFNTADQASLKIEYDGVDYTNKMDKATNSVVIPAGNYSATLSIKFTKSEINSIDSKTNDIFGSDGADVYNMFGVKVLSGASKEDVDALPEGIYIVNGHKMCVTK